MAKACNLVTVAVPLLCLGYYYAKEEVIEGLNKGLEERAKSITVYYHCSLLLLGI